MGDRCTRNTPRFLRQKVARPNDIELGGPGSLRDGKPARRAAGQPASCVSLCRALATLDKAVEMKVNFCAAPSKDGLR